MTSEIPQEKCVLWLAEKPVLITRWCDWCAREQIGRLPSNGKRSEQKNALQMITLACVLPVLVVTPSMSVNLPLYSPCLLVHCLPNSITLNFISRRTDFNYTRTNMAASFNFITISCKSFQLVLFQGRRIAWWNCSGHTIQTIRLIPSSYKLPPQPKLKANKIVDYKIA